MLVLRMVIIFETFPRCIFGIPWHCQGTYVKVMLADVGSRDVSLFFSSPCWPMGGSFLIDYLCILCVPACVARYLAHFKSVEVVDISKDVMNVLPQPTGCSFQSAKVLHDCTETRTEALPAGQLLRARVDCGQAFGFQNLTLYEGRGWCGRLSYRKYGNSSDMKDPTAAWIPWISNDLLTIQKGDVVDIQCVFLPFRFLVTMRHRKTFKNSTAIVDSSWSARLHIILDGIMGPAPSFPFFGIRLTHPVSESESCTASLAKAYTWKMTLKKSLNYSHWVHYSSSALELSPSIFPRVDLCCERRGEIFMVDKDSLHLTVLENPNDSPLGPQKPPSVKLDPNFYSSSTGINSYTVEFKLEVDARALPPGTKRVAVTLSISLHSEVDWTTLMLPVNSTGMSSGLKSFESWVNWLMILVILSLLVAAVCYVHQERSLFSQPPTHSCAALEIMSR